MLIKCQFCDWQYSESANKYQLGDRQNKQLEQKNRKPIKKTKTKPNLVSTRCSHKKKKKKERKKKKKKKKKRRKSSSKVRLLGFFFHTFSQKVKDQSAGSNVCDGSLVFAVAQMYFHCRLALCCRRSPCLPPSCTPRVTTLPLPCTCTQVVCSATKLCHFNNNNNDEL